MQERTIEDRLREEYFHRLPDLIRTSEHLKTRIQYAILPVAAELRTYESIAVKSRVKDCNSAIDALRRRVVGGVFDRDLPDQYKLSSLRDLVGVRVLAFPFERVTILDQVLQEEFVDWTSNPVIDEETQELRAFKYFGLCDGLLNGLTCEYQVTSMLTGLFWEVEHAALYKPAPNLKGLLDSPVMRARTLAVNAALKEFEAEFERRAKSAIDDILPNQATGVN